MSGEVLVVNQHLIKELDRLGIWSDDIRRQIIDNGGSIKNIENIPDDVKKLYKTVREIHPSLIIKMAKAMAPFVCQSMSLNLYIDEPSLPKILRFLVEAWKAGLKTGMYYCHTLPIVGSQKTSTKKFTSDYSRECTSECTSCSV
jgi:ribonucleoside-diphosphate reductase alpha chain